MTNDPGVEQAIELGIASLKQRQLAQYTYNNAVRALYSGIISQDDFDLFYDVWSCAGVRFSLLDCQIRASQRRLVERFADSLV